MEGNECHEGHPCTDKSAESARKALSELVGGKSTYSDFRKSEAGREKTIFKHVDIADADALKCRAVGKSFSRTTAWCVSPSHGDLSCALLKQGYVAKWDKYWEEGHC